MKKVLSLALILIPVLAIILSYSGLVSFLVNTFRGGLSLADEVHLRDRRRGFLSWQGPDGGGLGCVA